MLYWELEDPKILTTDLNLVIVAIAKPWYLKKIEAEAYK